MNIELNEEETRFLREALTNYLSDLREELVKTDARDWREALHKEEDVLNDIKKKLH